MRTFVLEHLINTYSKISFSFEIFNYSFSELISKVTDTPGGGEADLLNFGQNKSRGAIMSLCRRDFTETVVISNEI